MGEAGFKGIRKSVTSRQNTVAQYIATRPIMDLCERSIWKTEVRVFQRWWDQAGINLEGAKKRAAEAATFLELELESDLELELELESESELEPGGEEESSRASR